MAIAAIARVARESGLALGYVSTFFMVLTIGLAFAVIYKAGVPAKDAFGILWGSIYSLSRIDLALIALYSVAIVLFVTLLFPRVSAVLFHREIACASGVHEAALTTVILLFVGVSVALLMQLIGALLLDSILLLPAIIASFTARSTRGFFLQACIIGAFCSIAGFLRLLRAGRPCQLGGDRHRRLSPGRGTHLPTAFEEEIMNDRSRGALAGAPWFSCPSPLARAAQAGVRVSWRPIRGPPRSPPRRAPQTSSPWPRRTCATRRSTS